MHATTIVTTVGLRVVQLYSRAATIALITREFESNTQAPGGQEEQGAWYLLFTDVCNYPLNMCSNNSGRRTHDQ